VYGKLLCSVFHSSPLYLLQAGNKVELEPEAMENLKVTKEDFMVALQDIKPVNITSYILLFSLNYLFSMSLDRLEELLDIV